MLKSSKRRPEARILFWVYLIPTVGGMYSLFAHQAFTMQMLNAGAPGLLKAFFIYDFIRVLSWLPGQVGMWRIGYQTVSYTEEKRWWYLVLAHTAWVALSSLLWWVLLLAEPAPYSPFYFFFLLVVLLCTANPIFSLVMGRRGLKRMETERAEGMGSDGTNVTIAAPIEEGA